MKTTSLPAWVLLTSLAFAAPPIQESVAPALGPKLFRDGDVIEITDVTATSRNLEQGDSVTVKGRARLSSCDSADLCLFLTQTVGNGSEETDRCQTMKVKKGIQDFELKIMIKHQGVLHVTFYREADGRPFGGTYFGTPEQMKRVSTMDLRYYLDK